MLAETLEILRSPLECAPLELTTEVAPAGEIRQFLTNPRHGLKFPIRDGIPIFVEAHEITGLNRKFRGIYDGWAPFYDLLSRVGLYILGVSEKRLRREFVETLEIKPGDRVLATSVGTGADLPLIPADADYYGLDLSTGMLNVCRKKLPKLGLPVKLFLGQAEHLPFSDQAFDVVYQMGGINFFSDRGKAIREMIRVAKTAPRSSSWMKPRKSPRALERVPRHRRLVQSRAETDHSAAGADPGGYGTGGVQRVV